MASNTKPKGYYTAFCYVGFMPSGKKEWFVSLEEYLEYFYQELERSGA